MHDRKRKNCLSGRLRSFAAYAAYTDHEIGRVIQAVADMGQAGEQP